MEKVGLLAKCIALKNQIKKNVQTTYIGLIAKVTAVKNYFSNLMFEQITNIIDHSRSSNPNARLDDFTDMLHDYTYDRQFVNNYINFLKNKLKENPDEIKYYDAYQWIVNKAVNTLSVEKVLKR